MGRYVSPHGVEIEMSDEAAQAIGYTAKQQPRPTSTPRRRAKKTDDEPTEDNE